MKDPIKVKRGKKSRASGAAFELRVRKDLEEKGWIVAKWSNNVEFDWRFKDGVKRGITGGELLQGTGKLIPSKHKFRGLGIPMAMGTGFPDFIAFNFQVEDRGGVLPVPIYGVSSMMCPDIIGVEVKTNGYLDKIEREKCRWLLDNNVFSKIIIASKEKEKNRVKIIYTDFEDKYSVDIK